MDDNAQAIAELIRQGRKLEAVKLLREMTGMDLLRAKAEVERIEAGLPPVGDDPAPGAMPAEIRDLALAGRKIEAIRVLRAYRPGLGLKEAKEEVEAIPGVPRGGGCAGMVLLLVGALALMAAVV